MWKNQCVGGPSGKAVLVTFVADEEFIDSDFPFEQVHVKVEGKKMTGSPCQTFMNYSWSRRIARSFFHDKHILDWAYFPLVYWDGVEKVLMDFPQMFRTFITNTCQSFVGLIDNSLGTTRPL